MKIESKINFFNKSNNEVIEKGNHIRKNISKYLSKKTIFSDKWAKEIDEVDSFFKYPLNKYIDNLN